MGEPLRVLIVEDSDADCALLVRAIESGGYEVTHRRVQTLETTRAARDTPSVRGILIRMSSMLLQKSRQRGGPTVRAVVGDGRTVAVGSSSRVIGGLLPGWDARNANQL